MRCRAVPSLVRCARASDEVVSTYCICVLAIASGEEGGEKSTVLLRSSEIAEAVVFCFVSSVSAAVRFAAVER